jgi:hypothetical protein
MLLIILYAALAGINSVLAVVNHGNAWYVAAAVLWGLLTGVALVRWTEDL